VVSRPKVVFDQMVAPFLESMDDLRLGVWHLQWGKALCLSV
jgi:hypothetical protein